MTPIVMIAFYECILKFIRDRKNEHKANKNFNSECLNRKENSKIWNYVKNNAKYNFIYGCH